jgi:hypothetical protein
MEMQVPKVGSKKGGEIGIKKSQKNKTFQYA